MGGIQGAFRGQSCTSNFIEQGSITDLQGGRRSFTVPAVRFENAQDNFSLEVVDRLPRNFLQMDLAIGRHFRSYVILFPTEQLTRDGLFRTKNDIALDQI